VPSTTSTLAPATLGQTLNSDFQSMYSDVQGDVQQYL
jgi:hypothetical protein